MSFSEVQERLSGWAAGSRFHIFRNYLKTHGVGVNYDAKRQFAVAFCLDPSQRNDFVRLLSGTVFSFRNNRYEVLARRAGTVVKGEAIPDPASIENAYMGTYLLAFRMGKEIVLTSARCTDISQIRPSSLSYREMVDEALEGTGLDLERIVPLTGYVELLVCHPMIVPFCETPFLRVRGAYDSNGAPWSDDESEFLRPLWVRTFEEVPGLDFSLSDLKDHPTPKTRAEDPVTTGVIMRRSDSGGVLLETPFNAEVEYLASLWNANVKCRGVDVHRYRVMVMFLEDRTDLRDALMSQCGDVWRYLEPEYSGLVSHMLECILNRDVGRTYEENILCRTLVSWVACHETMSRDRLRKKIDMFLRSSSKLRTLLYKILFYTSSNE